MFELFLARLTSLIKKKKLDVSGLKSLINTIQKRLIIPSFAGSHLFSAVIELIR
jgi:hypothetical protein